MATQSVHFGIPPIGERELPSERHFNMLAAS